MLGSPKQGPLFAFLCAFIIWQILYQLSHWHLRFIKRIMNRQLWKYFLRARLCLLDLKTEGNLHEWNATATGEEAAVRSMSLGTCSREKIDWYALPLRRSL